jgi:predicted ATPase
MSKIKLKYFGPIRNGLQEDDGWIELKKVTAFVGNQGSGKSIVAKLISTFAWMEKALVRGDYNIKWFKSQGRFKNQFLTYHRIENYLSGYSVLFDETEIEYQGDAYYFKYDHGNLLIKEITKDVYYLPQIMYVPSERNFISIVKTPKALKLTSDSLIEFVTEFDKAKNEIQGSLRLPVNNVAIEYDKFTDSVNIKGNDYKLKLAESSSGFQSFVPLFLVSWFLSNTVKHQSEISKEPMSSDELQRFKKGVADIWSNPNFTEEQRRAALSVLSAKFNKTAFLNIVEEPEQNLFPSSQWEMLQSLLEFNNYSTGNKLIMTTHSPYIINFLSLSIQGAYLRNKISKSNKKIELLSKLEKVVSSKSIISSENVVVYQFNESSGSIKKLVSPEGIPSDNNLLNNMLKEGNELFDKLLEIEEEI